MKKLLLMLMVIPLMTFGQGSQDFENAGLPASYGDGDFTEDGIEYHYNHSRDQDDFNITDLGLMLRRASDSYLEWTIPDGIGTLSFEYRKAFTGGSPRQLEILIDDVVTFTTDEFGDGSGEQADVYTFSEEINVEGSVTIKIKNVGIATSNKQTVIDNIVWTAFEEEELVEYCIPEGTNSSRYIDEFSTTEGTQNINNTGTGFSTDGYGDFTSMTVEQVQSGTVDFTTSIEGGTAGFRIWVDWNQNGVFESDEVAYASTGYLASHTGSFEVPINALIGTTRMRIVSHWLSGSGDVDPCATGFTYGEFEDYTFEVTELAGCTGTPDAGTVADIETCGMVPFTLSTDGVSTGAAGLTYQWEESTDGITWVDIADGNTISYTVTDGVSEETSYRLIVTCDNSSETVTSDAMVVSIKDALDCYCTPTTNNGEYLSSIEIESTDGAISYSATEQPNNPAKGYDDQTVQVIETFPTDEVSVNTLYVGGSNTVKIWVDWNLDGSFSESELMDEGYVSNATTLNENSFIVPEGTPVGEYRMRVRARWSTTAFDACDPISYGSAVDFTVSVIELDNCDLVDAGEAMESFEICALTPFTLTTVSSSEYADGVTAIWQSSPAGVGDWSDIVGATSTSYTVNDGVSEATDYRYKMTCSYSSNEDVSNTVEVTLKSATECYCETNYSSGVEPITLVEMKDGGDVLFTNSTPASGGDAHEDFTSISANVARNGDYEITVKGNTSGSFTNKVTIYVDWNQDGVFDETSEQYLFPDLYNSSGEDAIESVGTITIPATALLGSTRMRVTKRFSSVALPCNTSGYGQTEDYTLVIEEAAPITCDTPVDFTVTYDETSEIATVVIDGDVAYTYEVIYGATGFNPALDGTSITTDAGELTATIENLVDGSYDVYVRTICGEEDLSDLIGPESFDVGDVVVPDDCEWTVHVWGDSYMDEVYWSLTDADNNVLLSRDEGYYFLGDDETLTVTAEGPLSFVMGADGLFSDNQASFTISNEAGIIAFGSVNGDVVQVDDLNCSDEALEPCEGTPDAGTVSVNPESGVSGTLFTFEASGYSAGLGITYVIEYRFNEGAWQELDVMTPELELEPTGEPGDIIEIRLVVTCENSGESSTSNTVTYTIVDEGDCSTFEASIDGDAEICEGDETTLTVTASADITSVDWDNGATGTELVVTEAGTYTATVTSVDECEATVSFEVTVTSLPTVDGIGVVDNGSGSFDFTPTNAANGDTYAWDFGDGETSSDENPTHVYTDEGTYTVTLTVSNDCGSVEVSQTVTFIDGVDCSTFTVSIDGDAEICEGETSTLTVTASEDIASVEWNNGETNEELVVSDAGTYSVTVTSVDGCVETASFEVTVNPLPSVDGIDVTDNGEGSYTFAPTNAVDGTEYAWDFGDGETSSDENPTHVYTEEGTYTVTLTVSNDCGSVTTSETVVYDVSGLDENDLVNLSLFPNPAKAYINIVSESAFEMESIVVVSPIGQMVFNGKVNGNNYQLDVSQYATGLYHVNIILNNGNVVQRNFEVIK